jgi:hypothetical protein
MSLVFVVSLMTALVAGYIYLNVAEEVPHPRARSTAQAADLNVG